MLVAVTKLGWRGYCADIVFPFIDVVVVIITITTVIMVIITVTSSLSL